MRRWLPWALLGVIVVTSAVLAGGRRPAPSEATRVAAVASTLRCPTCRGLSVADSNAPSSEAIRTEILEQVRAGASDGEIRNHFVARYGRWILLEPERAGVSALVWAAPLVGLMAAAAGLVLIFARRRTTRPVVPSSDDRALVDRALRSTFGGKP